MKYIGVLFSILILAGIVPLYGGNDWVFTGAAPGGHRGSINALIHKGSVILSAGEDGFLEIWNSPTARHNGGQAVERIQLSPYSIIAMAGRPGKNELCLLESDRMGMSRVSVWNYTERRNIFTLPFEEPITNVFYSMGGKYIIAAGTGRTGVVLIDSSTGAILQSPPSLTGTVSLAVTGKSERNMLVYLASGALSYWDLRSGTETNHFTIPANLHSPVLFSNNRYLAGVNAQGLTVINAVSGELLARDAGIPEDALLCSSNDNFYCVIQDQNAPVEISQYTIDRHRQLSKLKSFTLSGIGGDTRFTAAAVSGDTIALGNAAGTVAVTNNGLLQVLTAKVQTGITDAAVSGASIGFLGENGTIGFIPLNYSQLSAGTRINHQKTTADYNHITTFNAESGSHEQFILWQDNNTQIKPVILSSNPNSQQTELDDVLFRSRILSVDSLGGRVVFLDSMGNLRVVSPFNKDPTPPYTFFSVGLLDASFIDRDRLIIGRSAISDNSPFMIINVNTGETVPLPYSCQAAVTIHRGASGVIYATAISRKSASPAETETLDETGFLVPPPYTNGSDGMITSVLQVDSANINESVKLVDFEGEDLQISLVESPGGTAGSFAANIGGESAAIYTGKSMYKLDRTAGIPQRLIDGGQFLISLDRDGGICWHDSHNGKILAVFRLYPDGWILQTERGAISGN